MLIQTPWRRASVRWIAGLSLTLGCRQDPRTPPFGPSQRARVEGDLSTDAATATRMCGRPAQGLERVEMVPISGLSGAILVEVSGYPVGVPEPRQKCSAQLTIQYLPRIVWVGRRPSLAWSLAQVKIAGVFTPGAEWTPESSGGAGGHHSHHHHF